MASEAEIPESIATQAHENVGSMKEDNQEKNHLAVLEGNNENTNGVCCLHPPSVGKVAPEDMGKLLEDHQEPGLSEQEEITISKSNNQQMDSKSAESEEKTEQVAEKLSQHAEDKEAQKGGMLKYQEVESALHNGEPEADIEQVKKGSAEMNANASNHNNLLEVQAAEIPISVPCRTSEVLENNKKSESNVGDQEKCFETTVPLDPMILLRKVEASGTAGEESLKQCSTAVAGSEEMAQSQKKLKDRDKETLSIGASVISQTACLSAESDEELISQTVKEVMEAGNQPPGSTIVKENICLQQVGKDTRFEEIGQDKTTINENLKDELTVENKNVERNEKGQEEDMNLDKTNNDEIQILSSKTDREITTKENQKENSYDLVSMNQESLHPVEQRLALEPACSEKERSSELIKAEECIEKQAMKQEETERRCQEETVKMVSEDVAPVEATKETTAPEEGEINLPIADSEIQEKGNDTLEVDNFGTSGVNKDNNSETDAKDMNRYENSNISENENYSSLGHDEVAGPSEKEDENQYASSKFKPKEKEKQETEDSSEEKIHNLNASEERKTTEPAISEGNLVEAATEKDLYSATSMVEEEKTEEFLISGAEKRQEDDDESVNLPMEKEQNESTISEEDRTHEITKNIMSDYAQEIVESLQDEKTEGNLQHSRHQETAESNHSTEATLESSALEMADTAKDKLEDQKSTEKGSNPEASTTPLEGAPLETTDVSQILGKDSSIKTYEGSMEADNEILSPKKPPAEEKPKDISSVQAAEETDDTCAPLKPTANNLSKPQQIDEELEQEPFTIDPEAHALNMRSQAGHEDHNSKESSEQMTANEAEEAVDLTCQQDNSELNDFDKASSHFDEITNEENNNATPTATKEEIVDSLSKEESIIEKITEESTHSHHTIEESAEKVEAEIYQATGIENIQKQTSEEYSACGNHSTEPEKEETTKTRCVTNIAVAEKEGDDMQYGTSPTGAEEEETTLEKKTYHVKSSTQSDFTMESGMQKTIDKTEVVQTYHDHTTFAAQQEEKSEKGDDLEEGNESILKEENIISKEEVPCSSGHTTSITQALETSLESSLAVELKDEHSSNVPLGQKGSSTCLNDEDDAIISGDIKRVYDLDEIIDKDMVTAAENTSEESVDKHTEDEKSNMMQETDRKREDVPRGTPTDNIPEDLGQVSSTELGTLTPEGGINVDENPSTENCRNDTQLHLEDQPTHSNNFNHMASDGTEKEQTNQENHLNESTLEVDIVGNVPASSNTEAQVCPPIITDRPETEENNDIKNKRSGEGNSDHGDQNQEINVQAIGAVVDAEDIIRGQDDSTNISNDRLQIPKTKEEVSEGDNYNQENEGPINDDLSTEENTEPVDATEKRERCSESAIASKNSASTESNELGTQETQTVEDQDAKSAVNGCLEENDKDQDISITKSTTKVDAQGSENIADGEKAAKEVEHEEETQSIKKGVEEDVHRVMEKKADDEDILETVNEDSSQHYDESNALESHKIELPKDGREHEQIRFSDIHETKPIEDNEIVHGSEENSANEKGTKETLKASSHQDERISISNDSIQVFELQEEATPNIQLRNIKDERPNSITDGVSARENFESVVTTDKIEHHTNLEADNSIISIEAKKFAPEENSRVMTHPNSESSDDLCQDVHKDQGSSATGLETEFKDKESVNEEGNVKEAANSLELKEETQSFTKEVTEEIFQQVIMGESADDEDHSESNSAELDNIKTQKGGNTHEQSGSSHFLGTDMVKGEETVNQSLEESNFGYNMHNQESLQASMTNIDGENPVPINDEYTKISNVEIEVIKDQDETAIYKQQDNPDNRVENTISHAVTAEEINDPTEVVEKVECGSEYINLMEATKGETEATSRGLNDPVANSALSAEAADINLSGCSIEKAEDATQFTDKLEANEESQISQRHAEEEDCQQATTGKRIDYELENERNTCISDNMQVHEDEKINELYKSHEIGGSYLLKDKEIASQSLVASNTSVELPNQLTSTVVEASAKNVDDKMGILIQDESHETAYDKTQAVEVNEVAGTNAEGHTHENDVQETINSIPAEENPKQVDPVKDHECGTETTGASLYSTRGEDTDFQVKCGSTSIHVEANEDVTEEPGSSAAAKTSEECAQLEGSQLCDIPKSDITVQGIKEEEKQECHCDETANKKETVTAEGKDDLSKESGASVARTYEDNATSGESPSFVDITASNLDVPKEDIEENEKQGADYGETTDKNDIVNAEDNHDSSVDPRACVEAETSKESQCHDVPTPEFHVSKDLMGKEEKSATDCGEEAKKTETLSEDDNLSEKAEECTPLEASHSPKNVMVPELDATNDRIEEEQQGIHCGDTTNKGGTVTAETNDLSEEPGASDAVKTPEACSALEITQLSEVTQSSEAKMDSKFDIPQQGITEEEKQREVSSETAYKTETAAADMKDDLPEDSGASTAAKMSEECASLYESQSSGDVLTFKSDSPEVAIEEEKQEDNSGETACETETVDMEVKDKLPKESSASVTAMISKGCVPVEESPSPKNTLKEDIKEQKQGEIFSEIACESEITKAKFTDDLPEEPSASGLAKTEECACLEENQSSEAVLVSKFSTPIEVIKEEKQGVIFSETASKTKLGNGEVKYDLPESGESVPPIVSEGCSASEESQLSDIPKEGTKQGEMHGEDCGETACKTETQNAEIKDDLPEEPGDSVAANMAVEGIKDVEGAVLGETETKTETANAEIKVDLPEEPDSPSAAKIAEGVPSGESRSSEDVLASRFDIPKESDKEEKVNDSDETACQVETVHAQVNDDLLKEPGPSDVDINVELAEKPSSLSTAKISEEGAPSRENQSTEDVQASRFHIPKEGNKEVKGDDSYETACGVETMHAQINDDLLKEPVASDAEIKVDLPEEPDSLPVARISEESVPFGQSQSSEDVLTSDFDIPKDGNKEKGNDSEETACVVEIVHAQVHDDSLKEACTSDVEIKVDLAEEQDSLSAAKKSEEGAPLEESQTFEDVQVSGFDIPKEHNKEEEKGDYSHVTASGVEILHAQVNDDLVKEPGASDVEFKVDLPEEPDSLSATKISEDAPSRKSQSSEDVLSSGFNIPKESNKEEKGDESDETACGVENVHAQVNENLLTEPGTSDALDATKMSEAYASLAENQSSKDVLDSEYDVPKEDTKEEEKQGGVCSKTTYKTDIVDAGIKGNLSEEPDTTVAASLEESCFSEDASAAKMYFPNRDTNEDKQRAESGVTVDAKVKDDFDAEPVASIAAKTSEEYVAFEVIQSSEDVLVHKSDIQKEGTEEEKQGVDSSQNKLNIKKGNDEMNSEEGHLENTIKALQVSTTDENQQEIFRRKLPTTVEEIKNLTAEKVTSPELLHHSGDENVKDKSSQEQLEQSSSRQMEQEHETTSATKDTEEKAMNIQALKEERPDDSYSEKKIADETERQLDDSNSDFEPSMDMHQSQKLAENAGIRDKSSMGEPGELPLEFEGVNPPSDSERKNSESYTDSFSQDIINETELQFSSMSQQNSNVSLQTDATSVDQEQIDNSEQMSRHYGQELTKSEETVGERQCKQETSELIASENQSDMDFEKHEATTRDTDREKNIEPADPLEKLISSSEILVSSDKSSELLNANWEKNAETSAEDEDQGVESAPNCIGDDVRDTTVFRIRGNETKLDECSMKRAKDTKQAAEEPKSNDECPRREATQEDFQQATREITDYKVNSVTPKAEAPELPSHIIASKLEVKVQKNVKEHEVAGSNEIDALNLEIKEEVINQGSDNGSNYDKPNQHTCIGVEVSEQYSGSEKNIQNQDDSVEISNDTTEVIHIQEREEKGAEYHLNSVSEEEVKSVDKPYEAETVNAEEIDTSQKDLNGSSVVKIPEGWATQQEDDSEDVMSQEVDVSLEHLKEKQQVVACYNDMPKTENMIVLVKEEPHVQGNTESATDINSTVENEEEIPASDIIARELDFSSAVNDGKQYPTKVEEEENLAKRDTDADHSTENLMVDGTDGGVECSKVTSPMLSQDIEELTAADIIASQISLALEREEQLQQLPSEQLQEHEATTTVMGNNALDNHVPGENTTDTSLDETIRMSHLRNDGQTELGVPNLECELEKTDPEEHHKTISSELIDEHTSTMTSEAHGSTISDAEKEEDTSQASSSEETKAQSQYPEKQDSEISPEEDEKQPVLARANDIPDEKVLCHDPKVAQQDSKTESPNKSKEAATAEEQDTSTTVNYSLITGKTDGEAMKSYIVPRMPDVREKPSEEKGVTIEDDKDKNLLETRQMDDITNHENATIQSTLVAEKEEIQENYGSTHERKQMEADTSKGASEEQDQIGSCPNKSITITESHGDKVDSLVPQDPVKENFPIAGTANSNIEKDKSGGKGCLEQKGEETNDTNTQSTPTDSTRISSSDIMQRSSAQTCQTEKGEQIIPKEKTLDTEDTAAEEPQTDEEKEEGDNEIQTDSDLKAPFITETMRDMDFKATHKKSHNILSGVGSKVKHSISKVKKAITCSSSQFASEEVIIKLNKNKKN